MRIESIFLKNFKSFRETEIKRLETFSIFVGANGAGKSSLFSIFEFLQSAMQGNVNTALAKMGGSRGFYEVRSRNADGPIELEIKFREARSKPLLTYTLAINARDNHAYVEKEILQYRRGSKGRPWMLLNFFKGEGEAVVNEWDNAVIDESQLKREAQTLKADDILAIKGLAQFERFPAVVALGNLIERWHISDFHINRARPEQEAGYAEHLSREGDNLSLVMEYLHNHHPDTFQKILRAMSERIPGIESVESKVTEEGRVLLKFQDGAFEDPFLARYVSDGTIKMLAYLALLYDPAPHPLLCVEEPENQLYPGLLREVAEEFRAYAYRGAQVFVSTHSRDFLNAARLEEVFLLVKRDGYTQIKKASDDPQIAAYMQDGDQMGRLWDQGFFEGVDPQ